MSRSRRLTYETGPAWHRQPGESEPAFAAFQDYLSQGEGRTLRQAAVNTGKSETLMSRWSGQWQWVPRVIAHGNHCLAVDRAARDKVIAESAELWERRRQENRESVYQVAMALRAKGLQMIKRPISREKLAEDGKTVEIVPAKWTFATCAGMLKTSAEVAFLAVDDALADDDPFDPDNATPEDARAYLERAAARKRASRRPGGGS